MSRVMAADVDRLRDALEPVRRAARGLPWAHERPWRPSTHVWLEGRLPVVDLHDLGRSQAKLAVRRVVARAGELETGAVCFVTGRGRRSVGKGVLRETVRRELAELVPEGGRFRPAGPGRWVLILDPDRAPPSATGRLEWWFWLLIALFCLALAWVVWAG